MKAIAEHQKAEKNDPSLTACGEQRCMLPAVVLFGGHPLTGRYAVLRATALWEQSGQGEAIGEISDVSLSRPITEK